jgi:hypothetical protein
MTAIPYRRENGRCDLCGREVGEDELRRVLVSEIRLTYGSLEGFVYVCDAHAEGPSPQVPRNTFATGTSRRRPQEETLFG